MHTPPSSAESFLNRSLVGKRSDGLGGVVGQGNCSRIPGQGRLALDLDGGALGAGLLLESGVLLDALDEVLTGARGLDVLDPDVDALLNVPVLDLLVDDDADRALRDVVDNASLAVVDLEGHTVQLSASNPALALPAFASGDSGTSRFFFLLTPSEPHRWS